MKSLIIFLAVVALAIADHHHHHHEPQRPHQESRSCDDPDTLVDQLLQYSQEDEDSDSQDLDDIEVQFRYPPLGPHSREGLRGKVTLSKGQLSGISKQGERKGSSEAQRYQEGNKCRIDARLHYRKLRVEYDDVDIKTEPHYRVEADSYEGYLYEVPAYLGLEYDEDQDELEMKYYVTDEPGRREFMLKGAEEKRKQNPLIENEIQYELEKAYDKAMREQMKDIIKGYNEQSS